MKDTNHSELAISVNNVSKTFKIYSDKPLTGIFEVHESMPYYGPDLPLLK